MRKRAELIRSKGWALWNAAVWSGLAILWTRRFLQTRELIRKGIFPEVLNRQDLMADGILVGMGFLLAAVWWGRWFLHDKKKHHQKDEEK